MRSRARETEEQRSDRRRTPHRWFAWYPVTVYTDKGAVSVWLEWVWRHEQRPLHALHGLFYWEYNFLEDRP